MVSELERQMAKSLKDIMEYPGVREHIGSILSDRADAALAAYDQKAQEQKVTY